ncbi:MAG: HNH endonuclease signature motif containing protein [bacterium]
MPADLTWWRNKIRKLDDRAFGPVAAEHAIRAMDAIVARTGGTVCAENLASLARAIKVPLKFLPRAVATLTRIGIARATLGRPASVAILTDRIARTKNPAQMARRRVSPAEAAWLKRASDNRCACCGTRFAPDELVVDHLVPLSLLGADDPANWVVLTKAHNRRKWDRFSRSGLRLYRRERAMRPLGVRFRGGFFWPVINGRPRYAEKRSAEQQA